MSNAMHSAGPESYPTDTMVAARPEQLYTHTTEPRAVGQRKPKVSSKVVALRYLATSNIVRCSPGWAAGRSHERGTPK